MYVYKQCFIMTNNPSFSSLQFDQKIPEECSMCKTYKMENTALKAEVKVLKTKVTKLKKKIESNQEQWVKTFQEIQGQKTPQKKKSPGK